MGFFASGSNKGAKNNGLPSLELIHRLECKICPLNKLTCNKTPHMQPWGTNDPLVYVLGEAPTAEDDEAGKQFADDAGRVLRARFPKELLPHVRWNNVVRTHPPGDRAPEQLEIEACRPSVERDIAATKPHVIFGFGSVPLHWVLGQSGIAKWRGRKVPVEIGGHVCWYYAFEDVWALLNKRKRNGDISEDERAFRFDLQRAINELDELPEPVVLSRADAESGVHVIPCTAQGLVELEKYMDWAKRQPVVGLDYETNTLRPYGKPVFDNSGDLVVGWEDAKILTAAIGTPKTTFAFALHHPGATWTRGQVARVEALWAEFLAARGPRKAVHNLSFEMEWSAVMFGADLLRASEWDDTYTQAALLDERSLAGSDERRVGGASLDDLVLNHFGLHLKKLSPLNRKDLASEPLDTVLRYNGMDAKFHCMLYFMQRGLLEAAGLQNVYLEDLERVASCVLTQIKGVPVDQGEVQRLQDKYAARIERLEIEIADMPEVRKFKAKMKRPFNSSSNPDCIVMFCDILNRKEGYTKGETRENGFVSTHQSRAPYTVDKKVLDAIGTPLTTKIIELREAKKRKATYIDAYADGSAFLWPDGLLHQTLNPQGTKSGRTSAEDPNLQNMPKRNEEAKEVRKQIRPAHKRGLVIAVDYGQIQARGIAMMSKDTVFVKSLWDRYDVHTEWAERIASIYPRRIGGKQNLKDKKVMKAFRTDIKNQWTFPLFFGAQLHGIANFLQIPEDVLQIPLEEFWDTFHGVATWHEKMLKDYHEKGYVAHMNGRLSRAPLSPNQLFNYPIQGIEAEIVLAAMTKLSKRCTDTGDLVYQPNLEIHDDLTFILEDPDAVARVDEYVETIVGDMLSIHRPYINVPLTVEVSIGENLLDMEEVLVASSDTWGK